MTKCLRACPFLTTTKSTRRCLAQTLHRQPGPPLQHAAMARPKTVIPPAKCYVSTGLCPLDEHRSDHSRRPQQTKRAAQPSASTGAPARPLPRKQHKVPRTITTYAFANCARLVVPTAVLEASSEHVIDSGPVIFYYRIRCTLGDILLSDLVASYIKSNSCILLSESALDHEDVYAIADGKLYMALQRETFQRAGLTHSHISRPTASSPTYRLEYDLRDPSSVAGDSGSASYNRLLWAATTTLTDAARDVHTFSLVTLNQAGMPVEMDPALCRHFHALAAARGPGALFEAYDLVPTVSTLPGVLPPRFDPPATTFTQPAHAGGPRELPLPADSAQNVVQEWALELAEWVALLELGSAQALGPGAAVDRHLSSYAVPEPRHAAPMDVSVVTWDGGLIPPQVVARAWTQLVQAASASGAPWWAALTVHGVRDAPVSWGSKPHNVTSNGGENDYTLFKLEGSTPEKYPYLLVQTLDASDP